MNTQDDFQILRDERTKLVNHIADLETENARLREASERDKQSIRTIWGGDHPHAIFLQDGTKITIDGNKRGCWLKIGQAARIVPHSRKKAV